MPSRGKCLQGVRMPKTVGIDPPPGMWVECWGVQTDKCWGVVLLDPKGRRTRASPCLLVCSGSGAACSKFSTDLWSHFMACIARWSSHRTLLFSAGLPQRRGLKSGRDAVLTRCYNVIQSDIQRPFWTTVNPFTKAGAAARNYGAYSIYPWQMNTGCRSCCFIPINLWKQRLAKTSSGSCFD